MKLHEFLAKYSPDEFSNLLKNDRAVYMRYSRLLKNIDTIKSMGVISQSFMNSVDGYLMRELHHNVQLNLLELHHNVQLNLLVII